MPLAQALFQSAWDVVEDIDENSPDGQAIDAVLDELEEKCPAPIAAFRC